MVPARYLSFTTALLFIWTVAVRAGQSGKFVLINHTPYEWAQVSSTDDQMDSWSFPSVIPAGAVQTVNVEWDEADFDKQAESGAEVVYALMGTPNSFQLQARAPSSGFTLQALLHNIATVGNPQGSTINLGWNTNGTTAFVLAGKEGEFASSNPPTNWMQSSLSTIGSRQLRSIAMPGSHDAGMSVITGKTAFVDADDVLTQTGSIASQLTFGSRYFDIRPVIASGVFKTGHYSDISIVGWQGADGQAISDIINEINAFTASNAELIVLNLSHDLNTDSGYGALTQTDWNNLLQQLTGINHLFVAPNPTSVDLTSMTLGQFIGNGQAAVLVITQPSGSISLGSFATQGFYTYSQYNAYNSYSDTDSLSTMVSDQINKMKTVRTSPTSQLFLLSWTLTQGAGDIIDGTSILDLANEADSALSSDFSGAYTSTTFPNILYIDNFASSDATALAMAVNANT
ncbi:hypothetical protein PHLCEN_2v5490 [Hermanssonia centrifuga]|uniref:PLC-like phosphodiesterase n=1 Tax=Hermanssonia centrifuga TaxID=98765 RepID=A0A2R6P298_9APHY|nr:hypothetical protein PHLCEN_2v5490 [Hermanssonia centrifuga]